jgi:hypothetical protein
MTVTLRAAPSNPWHTRASIGSVFLCFAGGVVVAIAVAHLNLACQDGTHSSCPAGDPSVELIVQLLLAIAGFALTFVVSHFVYRRTYGPARAMLAVTIVLWLAWLLLVDAITGGLQIPFLLLAVAVAVAPIAIVVAAVARMR